MLFEKYLDDFGIVLKGSSLSRIAEISSKFENCFIVNNNNLEYKRFSEFIKSKKVVHFVNRSKKKVL